MNRDSRALPSGAMLTHFTRARAASSALDNLIAILRDGLIHGSERMIRGRRRAVCLFDAPLAELHKLLDHRNRHRYQPFGVAVDKRYAFRMGVRPVVYMPWREAIQMLQANSGGW